MSGPLLTAVHVHALHKQAAWCVPIAVKWGGLHGGPGRVAQQEEEDSGDVAPFGTVVAVPALQDHAGW